MRIKVVTVTFGLFCVAFLAIPYLAQVLLLRNYSKDKNFSVSKTALDLHEKLFIADLHSDSLMWQRNLNQLHSLGHVDFPRMREGRMALQFFTIVSKVSLFMNPNYTIDFGNFISILFAAQGRPLTTWFNTFAKVEDQVTDFAGQVKNSAGKILWIKNLKDLELLLTLRNTDKKISGGLLGMEGLMAIEDDYTKIERLYNLGVRMVALTHFQDTVFAGSAHGVTKGDLTEVGKKLLRRIEELKMIIDIAHLSEKATISLLNFVTRPVVNSHTGVKATCNNARNLSDSILKLIQKNGGIVGIGFFDLAVCGREVKDIVKAISHVRKTIGINHIALGSDFDGSVSTPFDVSQTILLTEGLLKYPEPFSREEIKQIMGENTLRILRKLLPAN